MIITCWILLIFFGIFTISLTRKIYGRGINGMEIWLLIFSIFISAITAGILFGGLKIF